MVLYLRTVSHMFVIGYYLNVTGVIFAEALGIVQTCCFHGPLLPSSAARRSKIVWFVHGPVARMLCRGPSLLDFSHVYLVIIRNYVVVIYMYMFTCIYVYSSRGTQNTERPSTLPFH